jgi:hypothetical protein
MHALVTGPQTLLAPDALLGSEQEGGVRRDGFRVVAPETPQRAALEKYRRANPGSVVQGKAFDVKHHGLEGIGLNHFTSHIQLPCDRLHNPLDNVPAQLV